MSIFGQDKTGGAFSDVAKRAAKASSALKRTLAFATAGLGVAGIAIGAKKAADAMGEISDRAQQMGVTADYAQKLAGALDQVGIKGVSLDVLADTFSKMTKETGATGAKGFEETLAAIASIGDEGGRVEALAKTFGRSLGPNLAPLVRQGPDALRQGLADVMAAMPGVSDRAVQLGDTASDALKVAAASIKTAWQEGLGVVFVKMEETFGMPFSEIMAVALGNVKWFAETATMLFGTLLDNIRKVIVYFKEDWVGALQWVWNGIRDTFVGILDLMWHQVKMFGMIIASLATQIWNALTGKEVSWDGFVAGFADAAIEVAESAKSLLKDIVPTGNDKLKFDVIDWDAQMAKRDELVATARKGVASQALLASGGVIESVADDAVKAIKDAAKEQSFTEAGTYAALKLAMGNRGAAAAGGSAFGGASAPGGYASSTAQARQEGSLMSKLIEVAQSIRAAVSDLSASCKRLEAI
jgi:hypothetical protein